MRRDGKPKSREGGPQVLGATEGQSLAGLQGDEGIPWGSWGSAPPFLARNAFCLPCAPGCKVMGEKTTPPLHACRPWFSLPRAHPCRPLPGLSSPSKAMALVPVARPIPESTVPSLCPHSWGCTQHRGQCAAPTAMLLTHLGLRQKNGWTGHPGAHSLPKRP